MSRLPLCHRCGNHITREPHIGLAPRNVGLGPMIGENDTIPLPSSRPSRYLYFCTLDCVNAWQHPEAAASHSGFAGFDMLAEPDPPLPRWPIWLKRWEDEADRLATRTVVTGQFRHVWRGPSNRWQGWWWRLRRAFQTDRSWSEEDDW